ncbi:MAG: hypothetical protein BMS9Abin32_227 [Gammaproteobacteria bacterium]|nr:MAG: hypothetical protein BMS9Abin32_227 [Gammaproteobacteria bacterium]
MSLRRGELLALDRVDLQLPRGLTTAVLGESGSGKSTLVQMIIGLLRPDSGTVRTLDTAVTPDNIRALRKRIGYAIQDVALFPHMTVRDNILLPAVLDRWPAADREQRLQQLLQLMQLPGNVLDRYPHALSGGQQQRAGLCRAMLLHPDLLLLDEPFSGLDTLTRSSIHERFLQLRQAEPVSTVLVTHDPQEAINLADMIVVMRDGRVLQADTTAEVIANPANDHVRHLCTGLRASS